MSTILITGASAGFGEATARLLSTKGHQLVLVARRIDRLEKLAQELRGLVHIAALDVRDRNAVDVFFRQLPQEFSEIDVLVNNAGLAQGLAPADEGNIDDWETMVDTNIKGVLYMTRGVLPGMKMRGCGHVVNIGSIAAEVAYKGGNVYGSTKAFVKHFSRSLRADLLGTNVRVTNIEPGLAQTEFSLVRFKGDAERAQQPYVNTRPLQPHDIAETVAWVIERPEHVNIETIEVMPTDQAWGGMTVHRTL